MAKFAELVQAGTVDFVQGTTQTEVVVLEDAPVNTFLEEGDIVPEGIYDVKVISFKELNGSKLVAFGNDEHKQALRLQAIQVNGAWITMRAVKAYCRAAEGVTYEFQRDGDSKQFVLKKGFQITKAPERDNATNRKNWDLAKAVSI